MRTYVRIESRHHPPRRPRCVLRVGRAARRSTPPQAARHRRRRGRARSELRGEGVRRADGDGRTPGSSALPTRDRGAATDVGVLGGEQGGLRSVRGHDAARRGPLHRRGVPRRPRARAPRRAAAGDRDAAAAARTRRGRPPDHGRNRAHEVPREGRERRREAERPAGRAARRRARLPPSPPRRAAVGSRAA